MTTKSSRFYRDAWTVLTFPKHNRAILHNGNTGKYEFYSLGEKTGKPLKDHVVPVAQTKAYKRLRLSVMILAGLLGSSIAFNILTGWLLTSGN